MPPGEYWFQLGEQRRGPITVHAREHVDVGTVDFGPLGRQIEQEDRLLAFIPPLGERAIGKLRVEFRDAAGRVLKQVIMFPVTNADWHRIITLPVTVDRVVVANPVFTLDAPWGQRQQVPPVCPLRFALQRTVSENR